MTKNNYFIVVNFTGYKLSATIDFMTVTVENGKSSGLQEFSGSLVPSSIYISDINLENTGIEGRSAYAANDSNTLAKSNPYDLNSFTIFEFTSRSEINIYVNNSKTCEAFY